MSQLNTIRNLKVKTHLKAGQDPCDTFWYQGYEAGHFNGFSAGYYNYNPGYPTYPNQPTYPSQPVSNTSNRR